jgi:DNA-binding response OmpR family regulator
MNGSQSEARLLGDTKVLVVGGDLGVRRIARWDDLDYRTTDAEDALRSFYETRPEAVLVDCPEDSSRALELIQRLRVFSELPILALADNPEAGVHALHAGADSVVPKPISRDELWLRVWRLLSRTGHVNAVLGDALVELDRLNHRVIAAGTPLQLTPTEFRLLAVLMEHPGAVLAQRDLLDMAWGDPYRDEAEVKLYVSYLRRKFAPAGVDPIETVRGVGYRYSPRRLAGDREPAAVA